MTNQAEKPAMARERLRLAHALRAQADLARDGARAAAARAREFVEGVRERRDVLAEVGRNIALDRSGPIKAAIIAGEAHPQFEPLPNLSAHAQALLEAQSQLDAAEVALAEIEGEDSEATADVNRVQNEVTAAAMALALSEANAMAEQVEAHEAVAMDFRVRLGGSLSPVGQFPVLTEPLKRVIGGTDLLADRDVFVRNGALWNASKRASEAWRDHVAGLLADPDSELNFDVAEPVSLAAE